MERITKGLSIVRTAYSVQFDPAELLQPLYRRLGITLTLGTSSVNNYTEELSILFRAVLAAMEDYRNVSVYATTVTASWEQLYDGTILPYGPTGMHYEATHFDSELNSNVAWPSNSVIHVYDKDGVEIDKSLYSLTGIFAGTQSLNGDFENGCVVTYLTTGLAPDKQQSFVASVLSACYNIFTGVETFSSAIKSQGYNL